MRASRSILPLAILGIFAIGGCYRTRYVNLSPQLRKPPHEAPAQTEAPSSWQHFFVYGWAPSQKLIEAGAACGGAEHVDRIETQRSFLQGLVAAFAGYYINIYSPYTGAVLCDHAVE